MTETEWKMGGQDYFKQALSDFVCDAACGGAIRHLADRGYTVRKIAEQLDFPMPYEKVQQAVWKHYVDTAVILLEEPGAGKEREQYRYIKEQNAYGTTSFRRVKVTQDTGKAIRWNTGTFPAREKEKLIQALAKKLPGNGIPDAYLSCDFGRIRYQNAGAYDKILKQLTPGQREYIEGVPWSISRCYHKLDARMTEILFCLCRQEMYRGTVCFPGSEERIQIV